ncbi:triple tyrosine motif-containing protein, partial [Flavobacterium sp.]|uniref:triple tyrosine motif-containing protein n=1 Tax=Flavobacterium sp. TaxID=239 RepID=UPI003528F9A3
NELKYTSITKTLKLNLIEDEQFWNILSYENWVVFQSLDAIYIYDSIENKVSTIPSKNKIFKSYKVGNSVYFQVLGEGLYEIINGKAQLAVKNAITTTSKIIGLFDATNEIIVFTQNDGIYSYTGSSFEVKNANLSTIVGNNNIYSVYQLGTKDFVVGTISEGIYIIGENGLVKLHVSQNKGLINNTVLAIYEDFDQNLWLGLDNGLSCINLNSSIKVYTDLTGTLGTVYATLKRGNDLYVGTNQGLFYKVFNEDSNFKLVEGTKGQVWSLFEHDETVFCGHDSGTFIVNKEKSTKIFSASGTWKFNKIPLNSNLILQGNYYGLSVLIKENGIWKFKNKLTNYNLSSRYFEFYNENELYVNHEYKGVFQLQLDTNFSTVIEQKKLDYLEKSKNSSIAKFNEQLFFANKKGVYKLNSATKKFELDSYLSQIFQNDQYTSGKIIVNNNESLWLFSENFIHLFEPGKFSNKLQKKSIPIPQSITKPMLGYENITKISKAKFLIGTTDGFYTLNVDGLKFKNHKVVLSEVLVAQTEGKFIKKPIKEKGIFNYKENNLFFQFAIPEYNKYVFSEFQYKLEGFHENWTNWLTKPYASFENLPPGNYTFKVKSKLGDSISNEVVAFSFEILNPWYKTLWAKIIYTILAFIVAYYVHKSYKLYYQKKETKLIEENNLLLEIAALESEKQMMKLKNEKLSQEFQNKSKELAASTMSLMKKDKLLAIIKDDLRNTESTNSKSIKTVISKISKNIESKDSWEVFKEAFDNADNDFLKKLKAAHPTLTPNDLRLCAYLRLNLSSKEIAPLLNISVRSVEIKRYRLRKKMELEHEKGLVEYILTI